MGRLTYKELSNKRITPKRNIVISEAYNSDNEFVGYSVAEQLVTEEDGKETKVFLKNGLGILSKEGIMNLLGAVAEVCDKL